MSSRPTALRRGSPGVLLWLLVAGCMSPVYWGDQKGDSERREKIAHGDEHRGHPGVGLIAVFAGRAERTPLCTATLIDSRHAVTAAHCFGKAGLVADPVFVLGTSLDDPAARSFAIEDYVVHPDYVYDARDSARATHDIAVIRLAEPVRGAVVSGLLPTLTEGHVGQEVLAVGYGQDEEGERGIKRSASFPIESIEEDQLVVRFGEQTTLCGGDSGGPAFLAVDGEELLAGVVSNVRVPLFSEADQCGEFGGLTGSLTRIDRHATFIAEAVGRLAEAGRVGSLSRLRGATLGAGDRAGETIEVPEGASRLVVELEVRGGDADLAIRAGEMPEDAWGLDWVQEAPTCASSNAGTGFDLCDVPNPQAGRWWLLLSADSEAVVDIRIWFVVGGVAAPGDEDPTPAEASPEAALCTDTCPWAGDGECDDGGPGSLYAVCDLGTDCADCGER